MGSTRGSLREALRGPRLIVAPFVYDGLQARIVRATGFRAAYLTGFGTAAARGLPDLGLLTLTEMTQNVRVVAGSVDIPVICDADTGYGNPLNVHRTVCEYEEAGAAALHIEDQVWPKRCGFLEGKEVIPLEDMVQKVRAACDARRDRELVVIARTDALEPEGWEGAERRARRYFEAGADLVFVDGIRSRQDLDAYATRLSDLPRVYNGALASCSEIEARGFRLMIHPAPLVVSYTSVRDALRTLHEGGEVPEARDPRTFAELIQLLGVPQVLERSSRYAGPPGRDEPRRPPTAAGPGR